jgi:hypothetical protein
MASTFMPAHGHSTALKFNLNHLRKLQHYFEELEMLFDTCEISNNQLKKQHACHYVDIESTELWEWIPEYESEIRRDTF